jgi:hypothetical protein
MTPTAEATIISIPAQPAYSLSPNGGTKHWAKKARETTELQLATKYACMDVSPVYGPVVLTWTVYKAKGRKTMDVTNIIPCLKPAEDQLVRSGVISADTPDIVTAIYVEQVSYQDHGGPLGEIECRIEPAQDRRGEGAR